MELGVLSKLIVLVAIAFALPAAALVPLGATSPHDGPRDAPGAAADLAPAPLDAAASWFAAANADTTLTLELLEGARTLDFAPEALLAPDAKWFEGDREIPITATTWSIVVLEDANAWGRVTLDDGFLSGLLATSVDDYVLEADGGALVVTAASTLERGQLNTIDGPDTPERGVRVASPEADDLGYCDGVLVSGLGPSNHLGISPATGIATGWPSTPETIVLDADKTYYDLGPGTWAARQLAVANVMDSVYNREFQLDVQVVAQHAHTTSAPISGGDSGTLLDQLKAYWEDNTLDREVVFLFVNKDLEAFGAGATVIGRAWCIGGAGNPQTHYAMMSISLIGAFFQQVTMEHEVGHLYAAHHHYANCVEAVVGCTVMINAVDLVFRQEFGSLERLFIRGWADAHT